MSDNIEHKDPAAGMRQGHVLDLKLPIGWLLGFYGVLLTVYGLVTKPEMYAISLGINLNLVWVLRRMSIGSAFVLTAYVKRNRKKA